VRRMSMPAPGVGAPLAEPATTKPDQEPGIGGLGFGRVITLCFELCFCGNHPVKRSILSCLMAWTNKEIRDENDCGG
jgi:hypothetical protein